MKKALLTICFFVISVTANAAYINGVPSTIIRVSTYGSGAVAGDVAIQTENAVAGCENGYYVSNGNVGKDEILSIALSAYHSGSKVLINGYDTPRWPGSTGNLCLIEGIHLEK